MAGFLVAGSVVGIALGTSVGGAASCGYVARRWMMLLAPYMYALPALPTLVGVSLTLVQWLLVGVWGGFAIRDAGSMRALAWTGGSVVAAIALVGRLLVKLGFSFGFD